MHRPPRGHTFSWDDPAKKLRNKNMATTLLKITGLKVAYGGIKAVKGVDLYVNEGELVTLIGS